VRCINAISRYSTGLSFPSFMSYIFSFPTTC